MKPLRLEPGQHIAAVLLAIDRTRFGGFRLALLLDFTLINFIPLLLTFRSREQLDRRQVLPDIPLAIKSLLN